MLSAEKLAMQDVLEAHDASSAELSKNQLDAESLIVKLRNDLAAEEAKGALQSSQEAALSAIIKEKEQQICQLQKDSNAALLTEQQAKESAQSQVIELGVKLKQSLTFSKRVEVLEEENQATVGK